MTNTKTRDIRGVGHMLAISLLFLPIIKTTIDAFFLSLFGLILAILWPQIPFLNTLYKKWPDWGIISYPISVGLSIFLFMLTADLHGMEEDSILDFARITCLCMAISDPLHGFIGRRINNKNKKNYQGIFFSIPILIFIVNFWINNTSTNWYWVNFQDNPVASSLPFIIGATTELWWRWISDNIGIVFMTWLTFTIMFYFI
ncbi:hypothetical protein CL645_02275 [bacterium]|nr:hypothetical protein [bacterium]